MGGGGGFSQVGDPDIGDGRAGCRHRQDIFVRIHASGKAAGHGIGDGAGSGIDGRHRDIDHGPVTDAGVVNFHAADKSAADGYLGNFAREPVAKGEKRGTRGTVVRVKEKTSGPQVKRLVRGHEKNTVIFGR